MANPYYIVTQYGLSQVELSHPVLTFDISFPPPLTFSFLCYVIFCRLQRLQELHLQENSIELLAEQALSGLSSLALLDLSRNHLRTLGASSLKPLVSLQVLRVTGRQYEDRI